MLASTAERCAPTETVKRVAFAVKILADAPVIYADALILISSVFAVKKVALAPVIEALADFEKYGLINYFLDF